MRVQPLQAEDAGLKTKPVVLIVDDDFLIRDLCMRALHGYRVFQAGSSAEALKVYYREPVDLVLTEVKMPGNSGIDLLRLIKGQNPNVVVIIMTGHLEKEVILEALKEGADDFISKPLNLLQLNSAVEKALSRRRLKEELANLKQLDRLKSTFLSNISHKLRTPITTISLFLQNIDQGACGHCDGAFRNNARLMYDETSHLGRLVEDLLIFSQVMLGSDGLIFEKTDLVGIVTDVLQSSREAQTKPGVETIITKDELPSMNLDRPKITFAIQQIIDNAFKFSHDTGRISIALRQIDDRVHIVVADSGVGIPQEELAKVLEKFYQIDPDNTGQVRGFGLGLYYAREFVCQHGGSLAIESEQGRGTTITITLPVQ
jgi:signal transduction histidine kinase